MKSVLFHITEVIIHLYGSVRCDCNTSHKINYEANIINAAI